MNELILIVEDEGDVAELLRYNLQQAGYRTVVAEDGAQALRAVQYGDPDLILLDVMLPEMDGWQVCRIIRGSERASGVPIIMLSALNMEEARVQGLRIGADDYVTKPFSIQELLLRVRCALDKELALRELRQRSSDRDSSLACLMHEMKNSLSVLSGYTHLALLHDGDAPYVQEMSSAADHMDRVMDQIVLVNRLEQGQLGIERQPIEVLPIIEEAVDALRASTRGSETNISLAHAAAAPVLGNRTAFRQVLLNLLSNAVKYNRPGGRVWVACDASECCVAVSVKDEGPGIPKSEQSRVFDKFFRGASTPGIPGSGLGLYVVKLLTEAMGGTVSLASIENGGTTVTCSFPKAPVTAATQAA